MDARLDVGAFVNIAMIFPYKLYCMHHEFSHTLRIVATMFLEILSYQCIYSKLHGVHQS